MCGSTKEKIAQALRRLMAERAFEKITVQNLMDATQMKRQSFYYHFQDTRDVLMWICRREVLEPLSASQLEFEEWILLALELLSRDRCFYRKLLKAASLDFIQAFDAILEPRMLTMLYPGRTAGQLTANQHFVLDFLTEAACVRLIRFVNDREPPDPADVRAKVEYLIRTFATARF